MQLNQKWLVAQGEDAMLLHFADTAFFLECPEKIAVAVSGGSDSTALLHLFARVSAETGQVIEAVTVDHGLRPEAAAEAEHVAALCKTLDVEHTVLRWQGWDGSGNLQAEARAARYQLITDWAKARGIGGVVLGHTQDDIAETFLMRLARGAGLDGLASMEARFERHGLDWARPLWQQSRGELRAYLTRHEITWIDDPSNDDEKFDRVKARKALKLLEPLGITKDHLSQTAFAMRMSRSALEHYTSEAARDVCRVENGDLLIAQKPMPVEIERRLMTQGLRWIGGNDYPPRSSAMAELDAALSLSGKHTLAGCVIVKKDRTVRITRELNAVKDTQCLSDEIWDKRWRLEGPHSKGLEIRALGEKGITSCPDWRDTGLPRASILASPAVWNGEKLVSAPLAGNQNGWNAQIVANFNQFLISH